MPQREARHDPLLATLAELVTARRQLCQERTRCTNQARQAAHPLLKRIAAPRIKRLSAHVALIEAEIAQIITKQDALAARHKLLHSVPGIGPVTAATR